MNTSTHELQSYIDLWSAANDAKATRISDLEGQCQHLQRQVARLNRTLSRYRRQGIVKGTPGPVQRHSIRELNR